MDEESSFIFYDSGYLQETFSAFQDMRIKGEHTDVTIKARNGVFHAHRVVLAARIPYFRKILSNQDKEISLNDIDSDVLNSIINFAYEGKLKVTAASVQLMLYAAVYLRLDQVQKACIEFQAKLFNSNEDVKTIKIIPPDAKIRNNFDEFCKSDEFLFLPYYSLKDIISRDDIKVVSEDKVFEAVMNWIKVSPMERKHRLPYLLPEIRMNYLSPEFLVEKVMGEVLIRTSDQGRQIVEDAKSYHLLKKRPVSLSFKTTPRRYADPHNDVTGNLSTCMITNHRNLSRSDTDNTLVRRESISCNMHENHVSEIFRNGIYAIRSICSVGTFVSNYDTRSRKWDNFSSVSSSECALQAASVGEKIFIFFRKSIEMFHLVSREWYTVGQVPITTECSGIVSDGSKLYIFGGLELPEIVRCFDTQVNQWLQDQAMIMPCHSMSVVYSPETDIFLTGGYSASYSNALIKFHPGTKRWTPMASMTWYRMDHASAVLNGKLYVCGGRNSQVEFLETVEAYDQLSNLWTPLSFLKNPRFSHSLVTWDKRLYVFGGVTKEQICSSDVEVYDPRVNEWRLGLAAAPDDHRTDGDVIESLCPEETVLVNLRAIIVASAR